MGSDCWTLVSLLLIGGTSLEAVHWGFEIIYYTELVAV